MQAEIITIGDEILIGQTVDTNSAWMGAKFNEVGVDIHCVRSVRDTPEAIVDALDSLHANTKLVLLTGGLGPTKDDLTKHTLNEYFGGTLVYREEVYAHIEALFASMGRVPNEMNRGQAELPDVCKPLPNPNGTASGMLFQKGDVYYVSMPGVPYEMKGIIRNEVLPWVKEQFNLPPIVHRTILTVGVPESDLASALEEWENTLPSPLKLAYLPSAGMVKLRLTARTGDPEANAKAIDEAFERAMHIIGESVYGEAEASLEAVVGSMMKELNVTVATAESCTGGSIGGTLTSVPGSSAYFMGGIISYSNDAKVKLLGVKEADLLVHGAVSDAVVQQMARGAAKKLGTDFAIATSGIAGPDGGTPDKPVGTVWIAVHGPLGTLSHKYQFGKNRQRNIRRSVMMSLNLLRQELIELKKYNAYELK